jgi:hypothetical protein
MNCSYSDPILLCSDAANTRSIRADGSGRRCRRSTAAPASCAAERLNRSQLPMPTIEQILISSRQSVLVRARAGRPSLSAAATKTRPVAYQDNPSSSISAVTVAPSCCAWSVSPLATDRPYASDARYAISGHIQIEAHVCLFLSCCRRPEPTWPCLGDLDRFCSRSFRENDMIILWMQQDYDLVSQVPVLLILLELQFSISVGVLRQMPRSRGQAN